MHESPIALPIKVRRVKPLWFPTLLVGASILFSWSSLKGATIWTGLGGDTDFANPVNWTGGVPSVGNDGSVLGAFSVSYTVASAMDDMNVLFGEDLGFSPTVSGANLDLTSSGLTLSDNTIFNVSGRMRLGFQNVAGISSMVLSDNAALFSVGLIPRSLLRFHCAG